MKKYEVKQQTIYTGETKYVIVNNESPRHPYFVEYNFMGGVDWNTDIMSAYYMELDEAEQIVRDLEAADSDAIQQLDDATADRFPGFLRFRKSYEDGSSAFFDPDQLSRDLMRTGYDEAHREIIAKALMAYHKTYQQNC